ncbi:hypothetical protein ABE530_17940 [Brucella sp. TWI559]
MKGKSTVARMAIVESEGVYLRKDARTPEAVAAAFTKIDDVMNFIETDAGLAHVDRIIATSRAHDVLE